MNYDFISQAHFFYQIKGYQLIDIPWDCSKEILNITLPKNKNGFSIRDKKGKLNLVGSAEQSYLQLIADNKLHEGKYITTTPCFRDNEPNDELHQPYFLKSELIHNGFSKKENLENMIDDAIFFFKQYLSVEAIKTNESENSYDIIDTKNKIELGSYGIRSTKINNKTISWIYGTAVAEPRLSYVLNKNNKLGYHDLTIPKNKVGSFFKILEEVEEAKDAMVQNNPLMLLQELSDLYGAIDLYLQKNHPSITIDDLVRMNEVTKRAFKNGHR